ncbi:hypothetical protein V1288_003758 [Bradyrhizobium sp. AZCC 2176]
MRETRIRARCCSCYRTATVAVDRDGNERPYSGDIAICRGCGTPQVFDFSRRANVLRRATPFEWTRIETNPHYLRVKARWMQQKVAS